MSAIQPLSALRAALAPLGVAMAAAFAPGLAQADAVAQSYLFLNNFTFTTNQALTVLGGSDSGDVSAAINGGAPSTDTANPALYTGFTLNKAVGPNAGSYAPGTALVGAPTGNYVGSYSRTNNGDPFLGNVQAEVDNTVSLTPGGTGSAQSNAQLGATFRLDVAAGTVLGVAFDAEAFLRSMLNPFGANPATASSSYNWGITLTNAAGADVFSWSPNGQAGGITGGIETADAFNLNRTLGLSLAGFDLTTGVLTGAFAAQTNALAGGLYFLDVRHSASADATLNVIPEPGALSLAGLALLAMGIATTRRRQAHSA